MKNLRNPPNNQHFIALFIFIFLNNYLLSIKRETSKFVIKYLTEKMLHNNVLVKC